MSNIKFKMISGGQTGVDRAALDVAMKWGIPYSGWCPAGRWAEDGQIPERYLLKVTPLKDPAQRTVWNVRDSDGVLILCGKNDSVGTQLAQHTAEELGRPIYHSELGKEIGPIVEWVHTLNSGTVNVAGPRESERPGMYRQSFHFLERLVIYLMAERSTS